MIIGIAVSVNVAERPIFFQVDGLPDFRMNLIAAKTDNSINKTGRFERCAAVDMTKRKLMAVLSILFRPLWNNKLAILRIANAQKISGRSILTLNENPVAKTSRTVVVTRMAVLDIPVAIKPTVLNNNQEAIRP
jgi:hypothetical protein